MFEFGSRGPAATVQDSYNELDRSDALYPQWVGPILQFGAFRSRHSKVCIVLALVNMIGLVGVQLMVSSCNKASKVSHL